MPDLITHYLFAKECLPKLKNKDKIDRNLPDYYLGCNGPDYFFYYRILPWPRDKDKEKIHHYGNILHNQQINAYFSFAFTYLRSHQEDSFYAYFIGYLMHYFLDRKAHPYIFYFSGVQDERQETKIYKYYHKRFEVCIDERMLIKRTGMTIKDFHPATIVSPKQISKTVFPFVETSLKTVYGYNLSEKQFNGCVHDFHLNLTLLYSKRKLKKKIVLWAEKQFHLNPFISTAMYSIEEEKVDYLNEQHLSWLDPCTKEKHYDSFMELYEQAKLEAIEFIAMVDAYLEDKVNIEQLMAIIDDRCFDTNQKPGVIMHYCQCVYEEAKDEN